MAASRRNKAASQRAFLAAYEQCGSVLHAARACGLDRCMHYDWIKETGPEGDHYRRRFKEAKAFAADALEVEARRRAYEGVNEPVIYKGQLAGIWVNKKGERVPEGSKGAKFIPLTVKKFSDLLLTVLLNANKPNKFRPAKDRQPKAEPPPSISDVMREIEEALGENKPHDDRDDDSDE